MTNLFKTIKSQTYLPISNVKVGDIIYVNLNKTSNGVDEVIDLKSETKSVRGYGSKLDCQVLTITTKKFVIEINSGVKVPIYNGKYVFRKVPFGGQYSLMRGVNPDIIGNPWSGRLTRSYCTVKVNRSVMLNHFDDPIKYYTDSKTKDYLTSKLVSKYSKIHTVKVREYHSHKLVEQERLIEFDYDPNNFLIPYKFHGIIGTFFVPSDVKKIGTRCFANFNYLDDIILPHEVTLKSGALIGTEFIPCINGPTFCRKVGSYKCDKFSKTSNMLECIPTYNGYSKGYPSRSTNFYVDPSYLKIGDRIKMPIVKTIEVKDTIISAINYVDSVLLDKTNDKLVFDKSSWVVNHSHLVMI